MGKRRDRDENTGKETSALFEKLSEKQLITRDAVALRVTIMMGQTGRYLETNRADSPLYQSQHLLDHTIS